MSVSLMCGARHIWDGIWIGSCAAIALVLRVAGACPTARSGEGIPMRRHHSILWLAVWTLAGCGDDSGGSEKPNTGSTPEGGKTASQNGGGQMATVKAGNRAAAGTGSGPQMGTPTTMKAGSGGMSAPSDPAGAAAPQAGSGQPA